MNSHHLLRIIILPFVSCYIVRDFRGWYIGEGPTMTPDEKLSTSITFQKHRFSGKRNESKIVGLLKTSEGFLLYKDGNNIISKSRKELDEAIEDNKISEIHNYLFKPIKLREGVLKFEIDGSCITSVANSPVLALGPCGMNTAIFGISENLRTIKERNEKMYKSFQSELNKLKNRLEAKDDQDKNNVVSNELNTERESHNSSRFAKFFKDLLGGNSDKSMLIDSFGGYNNNNNPMLQTTPIKVTNLHSEPSYSSKDKDKDKNSSENPYVNTPNQPQGILSNGMVNNPHLQYPFGYPFNPMLALSGYSNLHAPITGIPPFLPLFGSDHSYRHSKHGEELAKMMLLFLLYSNGEEKDSKAVDTFFHRYIMKDHLESSTHLKHDFSELFQGMLMMMALDKRRKRHKEHKRIHEEEHKKAADAEIRKSVDLAIIEDKVSKLERNEEMKKAIKENENDKKNKEGGKSKSPLGGALGAARGLAKMTPQGKAADMALEAAGI